MSEKKKKNMPLKTRHIYHNYKSLSSFKKRLKTTGYFLSLEDWRGKILLSYQ